MTKSLMTFIQNFMYLVSITQVPNSELLARKIFSLQLIYSFHCSSSHEQTTHVYVHIRIRTNDKFHAKISDLRSHVMLAVFIILYLHSNHQLKTKYDFSLSGIN